MTIIKPHHILSALIAVGVSASAAHAGGGAAKPEEKLAVTLEIVDTSKGGENLNATFELVGERGCARLDTSGAATDYQLEVCRHGGDLAAPVLAFDVKRVRRSRDTAAIVEHLRLSSKIASGQRVVVGKVSHGDGATEIAATVQ